MGLDYDELFPGRFMKAGEFKGRDVTMVISGIRTEELPQDKGGTRLRGIIAFNGTKKELVLNRTNGECFKAMFGRDTATWIGRKVTLYPAPHVDNFTKEKGFAIRVRGSPELQADLTFDLRLPQKKPVKVTLKRTNQGRGAAKTQAAPPPSAPPEPPPPDEDFGPEPPPDLILPGQEGWAP